MSTDVLADVLDAPDELTCRRLLTLFGGVEAILAGDPA
jgi:hypothetical protein